MQNVEIEKRLELLEITVRRQRLGQTLFVFIFILLTVGFYFQRQIFSGRHAVIRDKNGAVRLELTAPDAGSAYLNIRDEKGISRAILDDSGVTFNDARGQAKAGLFVVGEKDSGAGYIILFDKNGRPVSGNQPAPSTEAMSKILILIVTLTAAQAGWPAAAQAQTPAPAGPAPLQRISTYEPTYILPAYYTFSPDNAVYGNTLPNGQSLNNLEVKFQFSVKIALASTGLAKSVYVAYTQMSYWQFYRDSAFFRETNYQPELLIAPANRLDLGAGWNLGFRVSPFIHQSNGRGGNLERSWDRTSADLLFERLYSDGDGWTVDLRAWGVWRDPAYRRYNPDLARYLGYFRPSLTYKRGPWEFSLILRNQFESGFRRGSAETSISHYFGSNWSLYLQYFSGYGQSLIEYNHTANALGLGFALRTR